MSRGWETPNLSWTWRKKTLEAQLTWPGPCTMTRWARPIWTFKLSGPMLEVHSNRKFQRNGSPLHWTTGLTIKKARQSSTLRRRAISVPTDTVPELLTERWRWLTRSPASYPATITYRNPATPTRPLTCSTQPTRRASRTCLLPKLIENTLTRLMSLRTTVSQCTDSESSLHLPGRLLLSEDLLERSEVNYYWCNCTHNESNCICYW